MKKNLLKGFAALAVVAILLPSCKKAVKCTNIAIDISNAQSAYIADDSEANCIAYRDELQRGIDKCDDSASVYTETRNDLSCL